MTPEVSASDVYPETSIGNQPGPPIKEISMRMRTSVLAITAAFFALPAFAHELTLNVNNIKNIKGDLLVAVYDKEEHYNSNSNWVAVKKVKVEEVVMSLDFADLPAGSYAVKLFQDENGNGQIDMNTQGVPIEPYGFSNNGGSFGSPSFNDAKVLVDKTTHIEIQLR